MRVTQDFRGHHEAAMTLIDDLLIASEALCRSANPLRCTILAGQLNQLTDLLQLHFAMEDKLLYPQLMAAPDHLVAATARKFFAEMGDIGPAYLRFAAAWTRPGAIERAPTAFRRQCGPMFAALAKRMAHEDAELYPLAEWFLGESSENSPPCPPIGNPNQEGARDTEGHGDPNGERSEKLNPAD